LRLLSAAQTLHSDDYANADLDAAMVILIEHVATVLTVGLLGLQPLTSEAILKRKLRAKFKAPPTSWLDFVREIENAVKLCFVLFQSIAMYATK
jgi:hypothetical protein